MSDRKKPLKVYFVVGEVSGDSLGADLIDSFAALEVAMEPLGLGGPKMTERGLSPLFDSSQIAIMGLSAVMTQLPSLYARARQVADDVIAKKPDILLLVDSPEFAKLVARRVKAKREDLPVFKYVAPTVWSWRPGRAKKMAEYVDHVLAILPFEPAVMRELGGPTTTYVGHPLARLADSIDMEARKKPPGKGQIMLLPGSRRSETSRLLPLFAETVPIIKQRLGAAVFVLPAVEHLKDEIEKETRQWSIPVEIITGEEAKEQAMKESDAALAASGTALLELAMHGVPMLSVYKLDPAINALRFMIKAWTAALPNLIADRVIVNERFNEYAKPEYLARVIEVLASETPERRAQLEGFKLVQQRLRQDEPPGMICARLIAAAAKG